MNSLNRKFIDKFPLESTNPLKFLRNEQMQFYYISNDDKKFVHSSISKNSSVKYSGMSSLSLIFKSEKIFYLLPVYCNIPSDKLKFNYQYEADIFNTRIGEISRMTLQEFYKLKKSGLFFFEDYIFVNDFKKLVLKDVYEYEEKEKNVSLMLDVDIGLIIDLPDDKCISIHMDDISLLNVRYYPTSKSFTTDLESFNARFYKGKLKVEDLL